MKTKRTEKGNTKNKLLGPFNPIRPPSTQNERIFCLSENLKHFWVAFFKSYIYSLSSFPEYLTKDHKV